MPQTDTQRARREEILTYVTGNPTLRRVDVSRRFGVSRAAVTQFFHRASGRRRPPSNRLRVVQALSLTGINV